MSSAPSRAHQCKASVADRVLPQPACADRRVKAESVGHVRRMSVGRQLPVIRAVGPRQREGRRVQRLG